MSRMMNTALGRNEAILSTHSAVGRKEQVGKRDKKFSFGGRSAVRNRKFSHSVECPLHTPDEGNTAPSTRG